MVAHRGCGGPAEISRLDALVRVRPHRAQRETAAVAKMNRNRARGGDDDFGDVGEEPTFEARYAGMCATCRNTFAIGDLVACVVVDKKSTYHHGACRYSATAFLSQHVTDPAIDAGGAVGNATTLEKCRATTKKGKPCNNAPQKGEQFCGPHLT